MVRPAGIRRATVSDALASLSNDDLRAMMRSLSVPTPRPTRKADMAAAIESRLDGESLRRLWNGLDQTQQSAVSEVLHDPDGEFHPDRFEAKYGALPAGFGPVDTREPSLLRLFLYPAGRYGAEPFGIPSDLASRLRAFVPRPAQATLSAEDELPQSVDIPRHAWPQKGETPTFDRVELVRRDMESAAPRDLQSVLRLIDRGRVAVSAKTRRASATAVRRIAEVLEGGDFFDPTEKKERWEQTIGPIRSFAWPWLLQAGNLAECRGSKLALTKAGHAALGAPTAPTLRRLWQRWIKSTLLDEFSRIDDIKGQHRGKGRRSMTAASGRRPVIAEALAQCPVGRWVRFDEFSRFMRASSFDFDITRDPWLLYLADAHYGSLGYEGNHDWDILQGRYLLCLLFEYVATLGMIDVAFIHPDGARKDFAALWGTDEMDWLSRYDGLQYFRLNPLGAFCLGLAAQFEPSTPSTLSSLTVFPDRRLCANTPLSPDERLVLDSWANAESDGVWRLDRDRILAAVESDHDADDLRRFLAARDDQPLPETVEGFLRDAVRGARALRTQGMGLLIECADADIAARLATDARTARLCLRAGERHLVVRTRSEAAFRKAIRTLGYGMPNA